MLQAVADSGGGDFTDASLHAMELVIVVVADVERVQLLELLELLLEQQLLLLLLLLLQLLLRAGQSFVAACCRCCCCRCCRSRGIALLLLLLLLLEAPSACNRVLLGQLLLLPALRVVDRQRRVVQIQLDGRFLAALGGRWFVPENGALPRSDFHVQVRQNVQSLPGIQIIIGLLFINLQLLLLLLLLQFWLHVWLLFLLLLL